MITTSQFKNGIAIIINGQINIIISFQHVKPGKGGAFVRTKLRNIITGAVTDKTFRAGEKVQDAFVEQKKLQFLYRGGNELHFMDNNTYDQIILSKDIIGDQIGFLKENSEVTARLYKNKIIDVTLPISVKLRIEHADPGIRGDTAKQATKTARLETGQKIAVPLFVNQGDLIKVDTRTGKYIERA